MRSLFLSHNSILVRREPSVVLGKKNAVCGLYLGVRSIDGIFVRELNRPPLSQEIR